MFCISASAVAQTQQQWRDSLHALNRQIAAEQEWSSDLHLRKAAVNMQLQQWQYAVDEYAAILQREPHNAAALFYRAYANTHMRRYLLARNDYSDLLAIYPRHFEARLSLAYVLQLMDKQKDALDQLNLLVQTHPDSAVAYAARANMERSAGQHDAAIYDWEAAVRLAPHDAGYVASLADLLIAVNRRREARKVLDEATRRGIPRGLLAEWYGKL
ncbi:MAG: hypothetical protein IJ637_07185 [Prevotella sp.]|nr:hypothetical protein [Prevotella sp.]